MEENSMLQIRFHAGKTGGDCMTYYDAEIVGGRSITLLEFVDGITKDNDGDWGKINLRREYNGGLPSNSTIVEYSHGKVLNVCPAYHGFKNKKIRLISACGGYSRMDYTVEFVESTEQEQPAHEDVPSQAENTPKKKYIVNYKIWSRDKSEYLSFCSIYEVDDITIEKVIDMIVEEHKLDRSRYLRDDFTGLHVTSIFPV